MKIQLKIVQVLKLNKFMRYVKEEAVTRVS